MKYASEIRRKKSSERNQITLIPFIDYKTMLEDGN